MTSNGTSATGNHHAPSLFALARRLTVTSIGAVSNRVELLAVEAQEERDRLVSVLVGLMALFFLGILGAGFLTTAIVFLFPPESRLYVAGGFGLLYLIAAGITFAVVKAGMKHEPFADTIEQVQKDRTWLESLK